MPAINVKKRDGESVNSLIYRFTRRVQQTGILREAKSRRFSGRSINRAKRRTSALHRQKKKAEVEKLKKLGVFWK